jgi:hypothetical protein
MGTGWTPVRQRILAVEGNSFADRISAAAAADPLNVHQLTYFSSAELFQLKPAPLDPPVAGIRIVASMDCQEKGPWLQVI